MNDPLPDCTKNLESVGFRAVSWNAPGAFGGYARRNPFRQPLTVPFILRVAVILGIGQETQLAKHSRSFVGPEHVEARGFDPAVFGGVGAAGFLENIGGQATGFGSIIKNLDPPGTMAPTPIVVNTHEDRSGNLVGNFRALGECDESVSRPGFDHTEAAFSEFLGQPPRRVEGEDFFACAVNRPGSRVKPAMTGIHNHRMKVAGTLPVGT